MDSKRINRQSWLIAIGVTIVLVFFIYEIVSCSCNPHYCIYGSYGTCKHRVSSSEHYCKEHRCIVSGCHGEKRFDTGYCYDHEMEYNPHYCEYPGCSSKVSDLEYPYCSKHECSCYSCHNSIVSGTKYCEDHQYKIEEDKKAEEERKKAEEEERKKAEEERLAKKKTCGVDGCNNYVIDGGKYCKKHTCEYRDCKSKVYKSVYGYQYCIDHYWYMRRLYPSSVSYYNDDDDDEWPDCDDYDNLEDFLDDWEGEMPNGMDAEDYWENW